MSREGAAFVWAVLDGVAWRRKIALQGLQLGLWKGS